MGAPPGILALARDRVARLYVLDFGLFRVHAGRVVGIPGYLIQTQARANILIDTGFPPDYATDPATAAGRDGLGTFGEIVRLTPDNLPPGQLGRIGLPPAEVALTVLTHGHIDHVGGLPDLTHAPIVMTRRERAEPRPLYFRDARPMAWPDARYHLIDGDTDLCEGLTLIPTPGHTAGHLSVLVTLPRTGAVILAADAVNRESEPDQGFPDADDPVTARHSARRLFDIARARDAILIYGHDPAQWPALRKAPDFYD